MLSLKRNLRWVRVVERKLLGEGLLDRVRNVSIALFGVTTAVGLFLVALSFNQTWRTLPGLPIPGTQFERGAELDAADAESPPQAVGPARLAGRSATSGSAPGEEAGRPSGPRPNPADAQPVGVTVSVPVGSGLEQPPQEPRRPPTEIAPPPIPPPASPPAAVAPPPTASPESSEGNTSDGGSGRVRSGIGSSRGGPPPSNEDTTEEAPPPATSEPQDEDGGSGSERGPTHGHWEEER